MTRNFTAKGSMAIKHPAEDVAFVASKVLRKLTQLSDIKNSRLSELCTSSGNETSLHQQYNVLALDMLTYKIWMFHHNFQYPCSGSCTAEDSGHFAGVQ
jgi:hypothetical protein